MEILKTGSPGYIFIASFALSTHITSNQSAIGCFTLIVVSIVQALHLAACFECAFPVSLANDSSIIHSPGNFEAALFCIHSPIHTLLWTITTNNNWHLVFVIMAVTYIQVSLDSVTRTNNFDSPLHYSCVLLSSGVRMLKGS